MLSKLDCSMATRISRAGKFILHKKQPEDIWAEAIKAAKSIPNKRVLFSQGQ